MYLNTTLTVALKNRIIIYTSGNMKCPTWRQNHT